MNRDFFIYKVLPIILTINCLYIWVMIILGTMQLFRQWSFSNTNSFAYFMFELLRTYKSIYINRR